jgi:glycosyltransferase involved in cell wall biosynthesis
MPDSVTATTARTKIAVAICTYKRNDFLTRLLDALLVCADRVRDQAAVGVAVVDDTAEGQARVVAEAFADKFELGLQYKISGRQNISLARNMAIETAMEMGDWTVMTDDDCEPPAEWLEALLDLQKRTGADAVTGRIVRRVPEGSPKWITEQPFLELGQEGLPDGTEMTAAATFNSMMPSAWLKAHPEIRFKPELGVISGEDMVFFRACRAAGLHIRFSEKGFVYENEPAERATLGYQMYAYLWHGNSSYVASVMSGVPKWRMFVHGCASFLRALGRPVGRIGRGEKPQFLYTLALALHATGKMLGPLGVKIDHK